MSLVVKDWEPCTRRKLDPIIYSLDEVTRGKLLTTLKTVDDVVTTEDLWSSKGGIFKLIFLN